jgi:putative inorganic carbon (HCO3(-)) transporter
VILLALLIAASISFPLMPEKWYQRMETIQNYEEDSSANMRLNSWQTMFNLAKDRPITGGGFDAGSKEVYDRYAPDPSRPPQTAHSIYFEALGEHGFVGLALYLWILAGVWLQCRGLMRAAKNHPELAWAGELGRMMQVTLFGFTVGGVFLSLVRLDVPYYFVGVTLVATALVRRETNAQPVVAAQGAIAAAGQGAIRS